MKNIMIKLLVLVCFASLANIMIGQNIKRFEGVMKLPSDLDQLKGVITETWPGNMRGVTGEGYYDYYENDDEERVKHGKFYLNLPSPSYKITGNYKHGKKDGLWTFETNSDNTIKYSRTISLKITYKDDVLEGPCVLVSAPDVVSYISLCTITCSFKNGIITGEASLSNKATFFLSDGEVTSNCRGFINNEGMLDGTWTIHDKGGIERSQKRIFYKGALIYVEENDFSTGEKTICYSAFDKLKKAPNVENIKDTVIYGKKGIVYNGQIALRTKLHDYTSNVFSYPQLIIYAFPESFRTSDLISQQRESWNYAYSEASLRKLEDKAKLERQEREERITDSINIAQARAERERFESRISLHNYIIEFAAKHVLVSGNEFRTITPCNTDGRIKKCSNTNGEITFIIGKETVKGKFSTDYVKTDAGETFNPFPERLSSTEDGKMLLYKYQVPGCYGKCVFLIVKDGPLKGVYELSSSAQKCL